MANWISSKLKVAESLLQQIDQQAAESLRKNDLSQSPSPSHSPTSSFQKYPPSPAASAAAAAVPLKFQLPSKPPTPPPPPIGSSSVPDPTPNPPGPDIDWTELLGSPRAIRTPAPHRKKLPVLPSPNNRKSPRTAPVKPAVVEVLKSVPVAEPALAPPVENVGDVGGLVDDDVRIKEGSESGSDTGSESGSSTDSEDERRRMEERRVRRERMMVEKAAEAIKERENVVARLEGEKESLVKILEEAQRQQAVEASELQTSMSETMDAVELEKQKHNSTRMEALARLANLEITNTELAGELATTQWNLEVEVNRVAELRQQIEVKELSLKEHQRRMSKTHEDAPSLAEVASSKKAELEHEILDAEYSLVYDKLAKLKEKARKLEENIVITRNDLVRPTEVEVELKRRLAQLTDHLIQKQTQVEALSSEKATLALRMETASRLLDENDLSLQTSNYIDSSGAGSSSMVDVEAGVWQPYSSTRRRAIRDKIKSGQQHLGSVVQQLDAIFSAGLFYLRKNPTAQICALIYLLCLHIWVTYILMSRHKVSEDVSSGAVFSLETINRTSGI